jgi:hypothetical protein
MNRHTPFGVKVRNRRFHKQPQTAMTSSLDLSGALPYLELVRDAAFLINSGRLAYDDISGRSPPRSFLFDARLCISDGVVWTTVGIANSAYSRGLISVVTLIVACVLASGASYLIAGGTSAEKPSPRP